MLLNSLLEKTGSSLATFPTLLDQLILELQFSISRGLLSRT